MMRVRLDLEPRDLAIPAALILLAGPAEAFAEKRVPGLGGQVSVLSIGR